MTPVVSVIIPTYKHASFVGETLNSVFQQSFKDYEVIVVNDGSPDDTDQRLRSFVEDGRIRYFYQKNRGQAAARNRGLREARGEFIAFLDDDDLWPSDKLKWQVRVLREEQNVGVVYGQMREFGASQCTHPAEKAPSGWVLREFAADGWIRSPGQALIHRAILLQVGGMDEAIWGTDDWDLWLRLARRTQFRYVPILALHYRCHEGNASRDFVRMHRNARKVIRSNFGLVPRFGEVGIWRGSHRFVRDFVMMEALRGFGSRFHARDWGSVCVCLARLVLIQPLVVLRRRFWSTLIRTSAQAISGGQQSASHHS